MYIKPTINRISYIHTYIHTHIYIHIYIYRNYVTYSWEEGFPNLLFAKLHRVSQEEMAKIPGAAARAPWRKAEPKWISSATVPESTVTFWTFLTRQKPWVLHGQTLENPIVFDRFTMVQTNEMGGFTMFYYGLNE